MEPNDTHQLQQFSTHFHHPTATAAAAGTTSSSAPNGLLPPYYNNNNNSEDGNGDGGMVYPHSVASSVVMPSMESAKRKRGRPRKYGTPEQALAAKKTAAYSNSKEKRKQREQQHLGSGGSGSPYSGDPKKSPQLGCFGKLGQGFTPHVISVAAGEDVGQKIMLFMQQSKHEICILSASGSISNASLRQPATAGGFITYEGRFEIVSLCGSYVRTELGGRTGGLSVCLSSTDGQIIGGVVGGPLKAAGPVQVIVATFQLNSKKDVSVGLKGDSSGSKSASPVAGASLSSVGFYTPVESYGRNPVRGNDDLQTIGGTHFMIQPGGTHVSPIQATEWRDSLDPRSSVGYDATGRTGRGGNQSLVNGDYDQIAD